MTTENFVAFGSTRLVLGAGVSVGDGNIGSNGLVELKSTTVAKTCAVVANQTILKGSTYIEAPVFSNNVIDQSDGASVLVQPPMSASLPVPLPDEPVSSPPEGPDVAVDNGEVASLNPGIYGRLVIRGSLTLQGGSYAVKSLVVKGKALSAASLHCSGECLIKVFGRLSAGAYSSVGTVGEPLEFHLQGSKTTRLGGKNTNVFAKVIQPAGAIRLGAKGYFAGSFIADEVRIGKDAIIFLGTGALARAERDIEVVLTDPVVGNHIPSPLEQLSDEDLLLLRELDSLSDGTALTATLGSLKYKGFARPNTAAVAALERLLDVLDASGADMAPLRTALSRVDVHESGSEAGGFEPDSEVYLPPGNWAIRNFKQIISLFYTQLIVADHGHIVFTQATMEGLLNASDNPFRERTAAVDAGIHELLHAMHHEAPCTSFPLLDCRTIETIFFSRQTVCSDSCVEECYAFSLAEALQRRGLWYESLNSSSTAARIVEAARKAYNASLANTAIDGAGRWPGCLSRLGLEQLEADADADRVTDASDTCQNTPRGSAVDASGCSCSQKTCNDNNNVCTTDSCNSATAQCVFTNNTAACSDGNSCTFGDTCSGGSCQPGVGASCGNGTIDAQCNEQCDGGNLNGATCQSRGFNCGTLSCNAGSCTFNTSSCAYNECSSGQTRCLDSSTRQTCGNYDADTCLEWGGSSQCTYGCNAGACNVAPSCGGSGQTCCSGNTCNGGLVCSGGTCQTACVDECVYPSSRCEDATRIGGCANWDADPCLEWGSSTTCNPGYHCEGAGECVADGSCGGSGQTCCSGNTCNSGLVCSGGICQAGGTTDCSFAAQSGTGGVRKVALPPYSAAHDSISGDSVLSAIQVTQTLNPASGYYTIDRGFLIFNTGSLPDSANITSATLYVYVLNRSAYTAESIEIVASNQQSTSSLSTSDYSRLTTTVAGSAPAASLSPSTGSVADRPIPLNGTGFSLINKTGFTKFGLRDSRDVANNSDTNDGRVWMYGAGVAQTPFLCVTY